MASLGSGGGNNGTDREVFRHFHKVFASFSKFSDVFVPVWTRSDLFRRIRIRSDAYGCIRMRLESFGIFRFSQFFGCARSNLRGVGDGDGVFVVVLVVAGVVVVVHQFNLVSLILDSGNFRQGRGCAGRQIRDLHLNPRFSP